MGRTLVSRRRSAARRRGAELRDLEPSFRSRSGHPRQGDRISLWRHLPGRAATVDRRWGDAAVVRVRRRFPDADHRRQLLSSRSAGGPRPFGVTMIGRLAPGVPVDAATQEANDLGAAIRAPRPANAAPLPGLRFELVGMKDQLVKPVQPALRVMLGAVAVVLLIVCANVANLLLARGTTRRREIAVRAALGASRGRIMQLIAAECAVLALAGGVAGALIGAGGVWLVRELAVTEAEGFFRLIFGGSLLPRSTELGDRSARVRHRAPSRLRRPRSSAACCRLCSSRRPNHLDAMGTRGAGGGRARVADPIVARRRPARHGHRAAGRRRPARAQLRATDAHRSRLHHAQHPRVPAAAARHLRRTETRRPRDRDARTPARHSWRRGRGLLATRRA